jgi:hypothetical protein
VPFSVGHGVVAVFGCASVMGFFKKLFGKKPKEGSDKGNPSKGRNGDDDDGFEFEASSDSRRYGASNAPSSASPSELNARRVQSAVAEMRQNSNERSPQSETASRRGRYEGPSRRELDDDYDDYEHRSVRSSGRYRDDDLHSESGRSRSQSYADNRGSRDYDGPRPRYDDRYDSPRVRRDDDRYDPPPRPRDERYDSPRSVREYSDSLSRRRRSESELHRYAADIWAAHTAPLCFFRNVLLSKMSFF